MLYAPCVLCVITVHNVTKYEVQETTHVHCVVELKQVVW